jgi:hypothetical protein
VGRFSLYERKSSELCLVNNPELMYKSLSTIKIFYPFQASIQTLSSLNFNTNTPPIHTKLTPAAEENN